jgi:hypothetical protein
MTSFGHVPLAALALLMCSVLAFTQEPSPGTLETWLSVPSDQAGLVLIINAQVSELRVSEEFPSGERKLVAAFKGFQDWPIFIQQFRTRPGTYHIRLQGPLPNIDVVTVPGSLTNLRLSRWENDNEGVAIFLTRGRPAPEFLKPLEEAHETPPSTSTWPGGITSARAFAS